MSGEPVRATVAVLLPGSGSDHVFVTAAFAEPLAALGIRLIAPVPEHGSDVVAGMRRALDAHGGHDVLVGGISLGAQVAASWAAGHPGRAAGLLLALPAWLGHPGRQEAPPAAVAARASADAVDRDGVDATLAAVRTSTPRWLADELDRAWRAHGRGLADSLRTAAATPAPTEAELRGLTVPAGIAAVDGDPLHPRAVAERWAAALPSAALVTSSLDAVGRDRATLGRAAVLAWLRAGGRAYSA